MTDQEQYMKIQYKVDRIEEKMFQLTEAVESNAVTLKEHLAHEEEFQRTLQDAMLENTRASTHLSGRLDALVNELQEPLEDFRVRKYGTLWFKSVLSNSKIYVIIALGLIGMVIFNNASLILHLIRSI